MNGDFYHGKSDAATDGALVLRDLRAGSMAVIDAGARTAEAVRRYRDDPGSLDVFMEVLADGKFFSHRERRLGMSSPKLSKLCMIGNHAAMLRSDALQEHIIETGMSGYSETYQLLVYYNALEGDDQSRFDQLLSVLRAERPSSRQEFSVLTQAAKKANSGAQSIPLPAAAVETGQRFDLFLVTLDHHDDRRRLRDDHADALHYCQRINERAAEQATAVVIARLIDLPVIENKVLAGFQISQVFLLRDPISPDVTEVHVAVVAARGHNELIAGFQWLPSGAPLDAISLATQLVPGAQNKEHLLARVKTEGWNSVVGDDNWEPPHG